MIHSKLIFEKKLTIDGSIHDSFEYRRQMAAKKHHIEVNTITVRLSERKRHNLVIYVSRKEFDRRHRVPWKS